MIQRILTALHERGPMKIEDMRELFGCTNRDLCDALAHLVIHEQVHLEIDGTFWFAQEAA